MKIRVRDGAKSKSPNLETQTPFRSPMRATMHNVCIWYGNWARALEHHLVGCPQPPWEGSRLPKVFEPVRGRVGVWMPFCGRPELELWTTCYAFQKVEIESQLQLARCCADEAKCRADGAKDTGTVPEVGSFINRVEIRGDVHLTSSVRTNENRCPSEEDHSRRSYQDQIKTLLSLY